MHNPKIKITDICQKHKTFESVGYCSVFKNMVLCTCEFLYADHHSTSSAAVWQLHHCVNKGVFHLQWWCWLVQLYLTNQISFHSFQFGLPFVEVHRAREFTFRAVPTTVPHPELPSARLIPGVSVWNCDGEVQCETNIRIRWVCNTNRF
jgi:hypothetical protein